MIVEYMRGHIVESTPNYTVVDLSGIGYFLNTPLTVFSSGLPIGEEKLFYISTILREDQHRYFGFLTREDRDLFEAIRDVSGIGPKTALSLVGQMSSSDIFQAVQTANSTLLSKIPGIGKKTAERLIIDMRDKMTKMVKKQVTPSTLPSSSSEDRLLSDAVGALTHLGYNALQANQAIKKALTQFEKTPGLSDLLKRALSGI